jgi:ABC-type amino acid transport substrate-binding protein
VAIKTTEEGNALGQSKACVQHGQPPVVVLIRDQRQADQVLSNRRVQLSLADTLVAENQVKQLNGTFVIASAPYRTALYGFATSKHADSTRRS